MRHGGGGDGGASNHAASGGAEAQRQVGAEKALRQRQRHRD